MSGARFDLAGCVTSLRLAKTTTWLMNIFVTPENEDAPGEVGPRRRRRKFSGAPELW